MRQQAGSLVGLSQRVMAHRRRPAPAIDFDVAVVKRADRRGDVVVGPNRDRRRADRDRAVEKIVQIAVADNPQNLFLHGHGEDSLNYKRCIQRLDFISRREAAL